MIKKKTAQSIAEWGLMVALLVVVCMATLLSFAPVLKGTWIHLNQSMEAGSGQQATQ